MTSKKIESISFIGAGNVAASLAVGFKSCGLTINEIWSRQIANAELLAAKTNASVCKDIGNINKNVDLIVISVKDDVLLNVLEQLPQNLISIVHTSGSLDMKKLKNCSNNIGVLYPLQSFTKNENINWLDVPICVETNSDLFTDKLFELGKLLSKQVEYINSTQRIQLHIAAIFANNFSNYLYSLAYNIVTKQHLPFSLLLPLIKETTNRLNTNDPFLMQTGPAKRNDLALIKKHIELLKGNQNAKEVYGFLSDAIVNKASK